MATALAAWPAVGVAERVGVVWGAAGGGALAVGLLVGGLMLRVPAAITAGVFFLGAEYGAVLAVESEPLDRGAPFVAAGLLLAAELAWWSLELRARIAPEAGSHLRRLAFLLGLALGAFALGGVLLAAVDVARVEGLPVLAAGVLAAIGAVALGLAGRRDRRPEEEG